MKIEISILSKIITSLLILLTCSLHSSLLSAEEKNSIQWSDFEAKVQKKSKVDSVYGWSYIVSGILALGGGLIGEQRTSDPLELGVYTLFETMGVASIGYGAYVWKIGDEDRLMFNTLEGTQMSNDLKTQFLVSYNHQLNMKDKSDRIIRGLTHGLISALNFYSASQQHQEGLKTTLNFIGGVNLLAAISFSVEF